MQSPLLLPQTISSNSKAPSRGLADGVQSLTALIEAQTPSSKIENQIASLQSALSLQVSNQSYNASAYVPLGDGAPNTIAAASNIGTISGAAITNLTASEIPNLSGSYLSLNGGTVAGTTTITSLSVGSANTGVAPFFVGGKSTGSVVGSTGQALAWNSDSSMVARGNYIYSLNYISGSVVILEVTDIRTPRHPLPSPRLPSYPPFAAANSISKVHMYTPTRIVAPASAPAPSTSSISPIPRTPDYCRLVPIRLHYSSAFAVQGKYAYAGSARALYIQDISNPYANTKVYTAVPSG